MSVKLASKAVSRFLNLNQNLAKNASTSLRYKSAVTSQSTSATSASVTSASAASKAKAKAQTSEGVPLLQTIFAAAAGIATVSITAATVESVTAKDAPAFDPAGQRFDQSTFKGRFCKMLLACDPRLLLYTEEETRRSKIMVQNYQQLLLDLPQDINMTEQEMHHSLWEAQRISGATLHPDSGDVIPQPFRMSGYTPFNGPICVAMVASTSTPALLFWSWVNQSQNALVNYYNRNASAEMDNATLLKSYSIAVASALTVAFGLATVIQR